MLTFLKRVVLAFLYDEAAFQRWSATALIALGDFLEKGGTVPGTAEVVPVPAIGWLYAAGPYVRYLGYALLGGSGLTLPPKDAALPPMSTPTKAGMLVALALLGAALVT